jgi:acyl-CoA thioesterase
MANSLEEVRKFFEGDKYATEATGIVIEKAEKGHSVVSLMPNSRHLNAVGGLMGAVYYTMADFAFAVAENCILDSDTITVTQATQMNFLRSWHGGKITCTADIVKDGRYICLYEVKAFDKNGTELALIIVNGFKTARK